MMYHVSVTPAFQPAKEILGRQPGFVSDLEDPHHTPGSMVGLPCWGDMRAGVDRLFPLVHMRIDWDGFLAWATPINLSIIICLYTPLVPSYLRISGADGCSIPSITPVSPSIRAGIAAATAVASSSWTI